MPEDYSKSWDRAAPCTYVMVAYQSQLPSRTKTSLQGSAVGLRIRSLSAFSTIIVQHQVQEDGQA